MENQPKIFLPGMAFAPTWWAVGFPMAALANAALKYGQFRGDGPLWVVAIALLAAVNLAIAVLTVRTVHVAISGKLLR